MGPPYGSLCSEKPQGCGVYSVLLVSGTALLFTSILSGLFFHLLQKLILYSLSLVYWVNNKKFKQRPLLIFVTNPRHSYSALLIC